MSWPPKMKQPRSSIPHSKHGDPDGIECIVTCFNCNQKFRIHVGYSNDLFECPHCKKMNQLDES